MLKVENNHTRTILSSWADPENSVMGAGSWQHFFSVIILFHRGPFEKQLDPRRVHTSIFKETLEWRLVIFQGAQLLILSGVYTSISKEIYCHVIFQVGSDPPSTL